MKEKEFWETKKLSNFEKILFVYLQYNDFKSIKELELVFEVHEVTLKRALATLRKQGLLDKHTPIKIDFSDNREKKPTEKQNEGDLKESRIIAQKEFTVIIKEK